MITYLIFGVLFAIGVNINYRPRLNWFEFLCVMFLWPVAIGSMLSVLIATNKIKKD